MLTDVCDKSTLARTCFTSIVGTRKSSVRARKRYARWRQTRSTTTQSQERLSVVLRPKVCSPSHCTGGIALNLTTEDERLGQVLLNSEKDRAEHIMLVDLARNDVNRVCQPKTVKVDHLMRVETFSHVIHLTSQVSGMLRDGLTR